MTLTELIALVDRSARVRVPTRREIAAMATAHAEGVMIATGHDAIRGQWVQVRADDGTVTEISERQPIPLDVEIVDEEAVLDWFSKHGTVRASSPDKEPE